MIFMANGTTRYPQTQPNKAIIYQRTLSLLLDLVPGQEGQSVADPYYGGPEDFAQTWDEVSEAAQALVARLQAER